MATHCQQIARDNNFTATDEEIKEQAKNLARNQYLRYGLASVLISMLKVWQ
jgi:FKBP-type peptidyl-prolyl cis-trans isomerase (trigger factor)